MTIFSNQKEQLIEALIENIFTIEKCIEFNKETDASWEYGGKGILGIPAFILICSVIDTIGSYFKNSSQEITIDNSELKIGKASEHFFILNHDRLFNLNLPLKTINDFYSTYRSTLTHNNSLPANNFLNIGDNETKCFDLDENNLIQVINIKPLFNLTKKAIGQFQYYLTTANFSDDHKLTKELINKGKDENINIGVDDIDCGTGHTKTIITKDKLF